MQQQNRVIEEYIDNLMQIGTTTVTDFSAAATDSDVTAATESDGSSSGGQKAGDSSGSEVPTVKKNKRKQRKPVKMVEKKVIKKAKSGDKKIPTEAAGVLPKSVVGKKRHCTPMLIVPLCMMCDGCKASFCSMH